ncbi:MAG: hypothetical protein WA160_05620 [Pseudobdellovibrio sp.]
MLKYIKVCSFIIILSGFNAFAEPIDTSSHDLLIKKLTQIQLNLAPADSSRSSVLLRLADLHSEKARILSNKEINDGCTICKAGEKDRAKAIGYYTEALAKAPESTRSKVYLQLGHLYELQGQADLAEKKYILILSSSQNPLELAEAHLSLAENAFRKSNYALSMKHYDQVLAIEGASSQGLAAYRKAWCAFKLGQSDQAIDQLKMVLTNPKLQSRMAISRGIADIQFLEEVSRDLVTFMAARGIQPKDADTVYALTPENFKLQQVTLLAREGLRLGQKEADLKVWEFIFEKHTDAKIRLEAKIRQAQLSFDLKKTEQAENFFAAALSLWSANGCTIESCDENYKGLRQFVVGWNRIEIKNPSSQLITAYQEFLKVFPEDVDMQIWTAQAMGQTGQFAAAAAVGLKANTLLAGLKDNEKLEKNLLLTIENAEKAKDEKLLLAAQDDYLQKSILKQKTADVEYQKAYSIYQKENYLQASELLKGIALGNGTNAKIKLQAAELAMDALAILKDDIKMQKWSSEFAAKFPEKKSEFAAIYQKTILNQTAVAAKTDSAQALQILSQFDVATSSMEDKKVYLKNKILLSEKLNKIPEARVAVDDFLRLTNLSVEESEFALQRKAWFAELELDFATALKTLELTKSATITADQKVLKLALFAELAEKDSQTYYTQYLKQSKDAEKKALIAIRLIRLSKTPEKELNALKNHFDGHQEMLAQAVVYVYGITKNQKLLENLIKVNPKQQNAGFALATRIIFLEDFKALSKKIVAHQIVSKNTKVLAASLKERIKILDQLDVLANRAITSNDWSSQLITLDLVAKENKRFYNEVLSLPTPEGLTGEEEQQYLGMLSQQVIPHQTKSDMATVKVKEFWSASQIADKYKNVLTTNPEWSAYTLAEVAQLLAIAPDDQKNSLTSVQSSASIVKTNAGLPSRADLEKARLNLKQNPLEISAVQNILDLEKKTDRVAMVEYLESRLSVLKQPNGIENSIPIKK